VAQLWTLGGFERMENNRKISVPMRVFAGLLAASILFCVAMELSSGGAANWFSSVGGLISVIFVAVLLALCLYFAIAGRSP